MANLLSIPFKGAVDVSIRQAIRDYILAHRPDVHPDAFKWDISCWESLRKRACVDQSVHADRIESIYEYHGQLVFILTKLPVNVGLSIPFSPIFPPAAEPIALPNLQYERYGVLFNLAALQSQLAAAEDRSTTSGLKCAIQYYQGAAGTLNYLHSDVVPKLNASLPLSECPPDVTKSFLIALELLMLAQGQECAWQLTMSGYKNGLIAKLTSKISSFYGDSLTHLREVPQSMKRFIPTGWVQHLEVKQLHFAAVAQYRKSIDDSGSGRFGHEIARLSQAHRSTKKGYDVARRGNVSSTVLQDIKSLLDNVQNTLTKAERDNDLIYHNDIPTLSELPDIQERTVVASVASTKLLEPQTAISSDHPLFKELIGWGARTAIDIYKERRENWINDEVSDPAQRLDDLIVNVLRSLNLPSALDALERPIGLPPSLLKKAEEVRHENGPARIESSIENVQKLAQQDKNLLEEALDNLDQEAEEDEVFRADTRATRTPSQEANAELVEKATKWSAILQQAADSDELVRRKWYEWEPNIVELTWSEAELEASIPSSTVPVSYRPGGSNPAQTHARALRDLLEKLDDLQRVRRDQVSRAQRLAEADDITPQIIKAAAVFEQWVEVQPAMLEEILEEELVKFEKFRKEIEKGKQVQEQLLSSIKERNALFLSSREEEPMVKERERALQSLDLAYHKYKEITRNLDEGLKFYNDFGGMLSQFKETCTTWAQERRNEMISLTRILEASTLEEASPPAPSAPAQHKQSPVTQRNEGIAALDLPPPDSDEWEALALPPAPLMSGKRPGGKKSSDSGHKHHKNKKSHKKEKGRKMMPDPIHGVSPGGFHSAGDSNQSTPGFPAAGSHDYLRNVPAPAPAMPGVPQIPVGGFDSGHTPSAPSGYGFGAAEYYSHSTPPLGGFPTSSHQGVGYPSPPSDPYGATAPPTFRDPNHFDRASPYSSPPFVPTPHVGAPYGSAPIGLPQGPNSPLHDNQHNHDGREFPNPSSIPGGGHGGLNPAPPTGHAAQAPPSGFRIPLKTGQPLPPPQQFGPPAAFDLDGSPVFFGSAIMDGSVHPCKVAPHLNPPCRVPYGGTEYEHNGRYDLLPFDGRTMELVPTEQGRVPPGKKPVEGGFEEHGGKLYHALATINGVRVPGKTGEHLGGCNVAFGGTEHSITKDYSILCWK